ncbi:ATP-dependent RNA helicase HrpA [Algicola sagamiensis]|uniref:ATP-dependent RNA helicase HrpA n=1 Tax=Algicola sagamiensis TaxID=163869 RepID=UPI000372A6D1|nr:ATP-dependent RNA helicase HrpA [Algicola sagamiensis]
MSISVSVLALKIKNALKKDQFRFQRKLNDLKKQQDADKQAQALASLSSQIEKSVALCEQRASSIPKVTYPQQLPVSQKKDEIAEAIRDHQVVIIAGETGSGKTTQIPKICMEVGRGISGFIGHTQPRRIAARSVATRIAEEMNCELGSHVGYKVRFTDKVKSDSLIKLMTDGILLAEIQQDKFLDQYDTIIIDEAHERSLNIDFILGYLKRLLPKRPDLKVIITSATIDPERFSKHFDDAPIIEVSGRTYPVEVRYHPMIDEEKDEERDQLQAIFDAVDELMAEGPGDILIFMNGEREIRDTAEVLEKRRLRDTEILPLFARLSAAEQNRVFHPHGGRRIILSTNVAETSLTVPGIRYVIDPGTARISRYSYRTKVQRLPIEPISQASANQRMGRCGRVEAGICIRLYSEEDFLQRPEFTDPEILRTNLASVILQMLALGLGDIQRFPFVEPPDNRHINDGLRLLEELRAVQPQKKQQNRRLTQEGKRLSRLPIDPRLAKMVLTGAQFGALEEVMIIVSALSIQDPRERPLDKQQASDEAHRRFFDDRSDFLAFLNLWQYLGEKMDSLSRSQFRKLCRTEYLNYIRIREWQDIYSQLSQSAQELSLKVNQEPADEDSIHRALLSGLLSHIGFKYKQGEYLGARNSKFFIFPGSGLFKSQPKWLMSAELVETSKLFARMNARFKPEWVEPLADHLVKRHYSEPHWEKKKGSVVAFEQVSLYGIVVVPKRSAVYTRIDPHACREIFIREALVNGQLSGRYPFLKHNQSLVAKVHEMEDKIRRRDILVDEESLAEFYDTRVPADICDQADFNHWWKKQSKQQPNYLDFSLEELMKRDSAEVTSDAYPEVWQQGNLRLPLVYTFEPGRQADGVSVKIPLGLLNQVKEDGFDWGIPAQRQELIIALIKSLPKPIRRNFVPAPNYADAVLQKLSEQPYQGKLLEQVANHLRRMTGVSIPEDAWDWSQVPEHLKINFHVVDDKKTIVGQGRHLSILQQSLEGQVQQTIKDVANDSIERADIIDWDFGALPESFSQVQAGYEIKAFPALIDQKKSVSIELMDAQDKAELAHRHGLVRLILINTQSPIRYLQANLPNKSKLGLYFNPFGNVNDLLDDCIFASALSLLADTAPARDEQSYQQQRDMIRMHLADHMLVVAQKVEQVLSLAHGIRKKMKGRVDLTMIQAHGDINHQIDAFIFKGFVTSVGPERLDDILRYFQAIERRFEKLPVDPNRDRLQMIEIEKVMAAYEKLASQYSHLPQLPSDVTEIRWMIEELRVSLFAQVLGTKYPISAKRIFNAIQDVKA